MAPAHHSSQYFCGMDMSLKKNVATFPVLTSSASEQMNFLRQKSSGTCAAISAFSCVIDDMLSVLLAMEMQSVTTPDSVIEPICLVFPVLLFHIVSFVIGSFEVVQFVLDDGNLLLL